MGVTIVFAILALLASPARGPRAGNAPGRWVDSWTTAQQQLESGHALDAADLRGATLRQIVHLTLGGNQIRLRLSNRFGATPLRLAVVHIARAVSPASSRIAPGTDHMLEFSGSHEVTIPPHADYVSDPVQLAVAPLSDVAVTLRIEVAPQEQTGHPGSRATSYIAHGDLISAPELPEAKAVEHWYFISGIEVAASPEAGALVVLGDSITDGRGATVNGNDRWTDILAERLQSKPNSRNIAVLNEGIGGNRLLSDGLGPNALSRFDHDVIAQSGVRYLIVLEGINDIGMLTHNGDVQSAEHEALVRRMIGSYQQIIARAHTHGIKVIGATLLPFAGSSYYHPGPASEADRQAVNEWIRASGHFDAVIDFDKIARDPDHPDRLQAAFDSGDHLHPSPTGYAAMARGVPVSLFACR